ncbi:lysophospholipid acyltransferase 7 [Grus japonensis]|uniref:Leukocyte receptor cluster member 4 n=1 Tax=Grus japonensis TaxID=30415 RepID=A0ABC9XXH9_GRUJA
MTPEEVTYLAVLLFSIVIGFAFKGRGPRTRQFGGAAVGAGLTLLTCGPHALHSLLTALGTWVLLRVLPRRCGGAAMAWTFGYLLFFRTARSWGLPEPPPYANALQLLLTLKMVSLACDVQELREAERKKATSEELEELIGSLRSCPGLVEILCYSYCYLGLLTGPFYRFGTHQDWVRGPVPETSVRGVLRRVRWVPALGALGEAAGRLFPLGAVREPGFGERALPFRLFYMAPVFFAFRMRFYVGWLCAEAACLAAAFGGYPQAARPRPGCGPTCAWPRPQRGEELPPALWDFETIRSIDVLGTETGRRFRGGLRTWNMTVQWWLAHYVHRRGPRGAPALRSAWTMLVSAYWHGLHPGYYLSFLSVPLWLAAEGAAELALGGRLGRRGTALAHGLQWFLKMRAYDYLCMGFVLLDAAATLRYWASVYFCLHLLPLFIFIVATVAGPGPGGGGKERGEGGGVGGKAPLRPEMEDAPKREGEGADGGDTGGGNREHEEEKRQEQERRERALGVLTYLGQSAAEAQTCPPWYQRPPPARGRDVSGDVTAAPEEAAKRKAALDPLLDIRRGLRRHRNPPATQRPPPPPPRPNRGGSGPPSLEELRRQRLRREAEEAARSRALLEGLREKGGPPPQNQPPPDERARPYNSQFNPHLARGARGGPPREKPPKIG